MLSEWVGQGKSVKNRQILDENLLSSFHRILYHETTINSTKIKKVENVPCHKYKLIRFTRDIGNLQKIFTTYFGYLIF